MGNHIFAPSIGANGMILRGGTSEAAFPVITRDGCVPRLTPVIKPDGLSDADFYDLFSSGVIVPSWYRGECRLGRLDDQDAGLGGAKGGV